MNPSNRLKKLETILNPPQKERFIMSAEEIELRKTAYRNGLWNMELTSPDYVLKPYYLMREILLKVLVKDSSEEDKAKIYQKFDHFFFEIITAEERGVFLLELFHRDQLPDNYEFIFLKKLDASLAS